MATFMLAVLDNPRPMAPAFVTTAQREEKREREGIGEVFRDTASIRRDVWRHSLVVGSSTAHLMPTFCHRRRFSSSSCSIF
ncbi:unnamed protein product [Strongylus vulgaris]|uniref:Uncharacterized protein n=1 Tax=Strongylus vulgaris TaxID=40348 RepID=A0A3P7JMZ2_STRVU|nr:unnamed protein product [Strongylus vulgaris]